MIGIISALEEELILFKENSEIVQEVVQAGIKRVDFMKIFNIFNNP